MVNKKIMDTTFNRGVYNRSRKIYLENKGLIKCARCLYHGIENETKKLYGFNIFSSKTRYPNWKLVSKNKKQWMKKSLKIEHKNLKYFDDYFEIFF